MQSYLDASGNPVTQQLQSVVVTDASGNPVTGMFRSSNDIKNIQIILLSFITITILFRC